MVNEGDICPKCKKGRIALACAFVSEVEPDQEPFKNGKLEEIPGAEYGFKLNDQIIVTVLACHNCGHIISANTDIGYWDGKK